MCVHVNDVDIALLHINHISAFTLNVQEYLICYDKSSIFHKNLMN